MPTEMDVEAHDGNRSSELWKSVPAGWCCPGCDRTRLGLLRASRKKGRTWSARLHKHIDYLLIDTADGAMFVNSHRNLVTCGDCASILTGVKQRDGALAHDRAFLEVADLRALANPEDHQPHDVNWEVATLRVRGNLDWRHAVDSYRDHHGEAQNCRSLLAIAQDELGPTDAIHWAHAHYLRQHPGWAEDEIASYVDVRLEDAKRLPRFLG